MICKKITVENFRNISSASLCFDSGVNLLVGDNAEGKTNLLESIYFVAVGKSFRGAKEAEVIKFSEESAKISLDFEDSHREQNIEIKLLRNKNRQVFKNKVKIPRMSEIVGEFRAVLFCPEHLSLIKDGPSERRSFLDVAISQLSPVYLSSLQRYNRILKERNKLIKNAYDDRKTFDDTVEFWSEQLATEAALISKFRVEYIEKLEKYVGQCFFDMSGEREKTSIAYCGSAGLSKEDYFNTEKTKEKYIELLSRSHEREIGAGATLWGIHKDDIEIMLNGKAARIFASQGQQRSLSLALKLAEGEICREKFGEYPVFLLDDVLSELDASRREYLMNGIVGKQVIMTSCELSDLAKLRSKNVVRVKNGEYFVD